MVDEEEGSARPRFYSVAEVARMFGKAVDGMVEAAIARQAVVDATGWA